MLLANNIVIVPAVMVFRHQSFQCTIIAYYKGLLVPQIRIRIQMLLLLLLLILFFDARDVPCLTRHDDCDVIIIHRERSYNTSIPAAPGGDCSESINGDAMPTFHPGILHLLTRLSVLFVYCTNGECHNNPVAGLCWGCVVCTGSSVVCGVWCVVCMWW